MKDIEAAFREFVDRVTSTLTHGSEADRKDLLEFTKQLRWHLEPTNLKIRQFLSGDFQ